jgi:zinc/manganese transport system substrate-binding protein
MRKLILTIFLSLFLSTPALAELNVVATLSWIGSLARTLGGAQVAVTTLIKPNQDPHMVEAKPSMILAERKADIIMYNGLDLEIGYLPLILESARNPKIVPGQPGNFDCSRFVQVIEKPTAVDRSMGDVHPLGNPHYYFSPSNILRVASGMTDALVGLDPAHADLFRQNFKKFSETFGRKQREWQALGLRGKKFVAYHKLFEYLAPEFGLNFVGYIEPKPGIPPSAGHVEDLIESMRNSKPDGILTTSYYGRRESESIGGKTGVKVILLPGDVGAMAGTDDWFAFMDKVLKALQ